MWKLLRLLVAGLALLAELALSALQSKVWRLSLIFFVRTDSFYSLLFTFCCVYLFPSPPCYHSSAA